MSGQWTPAGGPFRGGGQQVGGQQVGGQQVGGQRTAATLSAVVTALALIAVLVIALATSDDAGGTGAAGLGGSGGGSSAVGSSDPSQDGSSSSGSDRSSSGGVPGSSSEQHSAVSPQYLKTHFPLPPGTVPASDEIVQPGQKAYRVRATLASVKAFYTDQLRALGVPVAHWIPSEGGPHHSVNGYLFSYTQNDDDLPFEVTVALGIDPAKRSVVTIERTLVCGRNPTPETSPAC